MGWNHRALLARLGNLRHWAATDRDKIWRRFWSGSNMLTFEPNL